jgi:hypothetical protein
VFTARYFPLKNQTIDFKGVLKVGTASAISMA